MSNKTLWLLAISAAASAQEPQKEAPKYYREEIVQRIMKVRGLDERNKRIRAQAGAEFETLTPLVRTVQSRFGPRQAKLTGDGRLLRFDESVANVIGENEHFKTYNEISIYIRLLDSVEEAGLTAAIQLSLIPVQFHDGSFSGMPLGDWAMKNLWGSRPALMFTRGNAFVKLICQPAIELKKNDKTMRGVDDPGVIDICEGLARDIDAQLQELPTKQRQ